MRDPIKLQFLKSGANFTPQQKQHFATLTHMDEWNLDVAINAIVTFDHAEQDQAATAKITRPSAVDAEQYPGPIDQGDDDNDDDDENSDTADVMVNVEDLGLHSIGEPYTMTFEDYDALLADLESEKIHFDDREEAQAALRLRTLGKNTQGVSVMMQKEVYSEPR